MRHINHDYALNFDDPTDQFWSEHILLLNLMTLAARNYHFLKAHPDTPKLYDAGIAYITPEQLERRPSDSAIRDLERFLRTRLRLSAAEIQHHLDLARGVEIFRDIPRIIENGGGDCDNLAGWRAAELAIEGVNARPYMTNRKEGGRTIYHALTIWPDGSSEDPSRILGMPCAAGERREECRKNWERYDNYWQDAKRMIAAEGGGMARAAELKAKIDALGLLPKDGVFRVPARPAPKKRRWFGLLRGRNA